MTEQALHYQDHVHHDWVDYNGHMNDAAYAKVFSLAVEAFMDTIGLNADGREQHSYTIFTLETHLCYLQEAHQDEQLTVNVQLLDIDAKRLHVIFLMKNVNDDLLATSEQMLMGIDTDQERPAPFPDSVASTVEAIWNEHKQLEAPKQMGRKIGIKRKK
ncbi:acyl-CoA thioester hydrolase [Gracilibacillus orientalis]|uniref:Acyl-CoA thioester hydrolase n=1 Tax=Gracilibacillus orientalis TaxID=334253 RepID=A0A1I4IYS7_9BACI|nr:thioesterase family protein [Gracilibacillus orientalis]SFL59474.1 acyl-CoA thioester hydrolase [Gracilibacillus orientalis]